MNGRKRLCCLLLSLLMLSGMLPALADSAYEIPEAVAGEELRTAQTAALYYRFQDEPYLAA